MRIKLLQQKLPLLEFSPTTCKDSGAAGANSMQWQKPASGSITAVVGVFSNNVQRLRCCRSKLHAAA